MTTSGWGQDFAIVAGADLSGQQYKLIGPTGALCRSADNYIGVLQNKPQSGEHATVRKLGMTKLYMPISAGVGAELMASNATSGVPALVTSGYCAFGQVWTYGASGGYATVWLYTGAVGRKLA